MITYVDYAKLRDEKGLRDSDVARLAKIPPSTFTDWKKETSSPKMPKLEKIAVALGYGDYYSLERTVKPSYDLGAMVDELQQRANEKAHAQAVLGLSEQEMNLIRQWRLADSATRTMIIRIMAFSAQGGDINID